MTPNDLDDLDDLDNFDEPDDCDSTMSILFTLLSFQALLGAFDNLWHHELQAALPQRAGARRELALHAAREAIYAVIFIGLAWSQWHGLWAALLATLLVVELFITVADFLEEDRTRRLPPLERALHTVLSISYGLLLGLMAPVLLQWWHAPTALVATAHGAMSWWLTFYGVGVAAWSVRNALAARRLPAVAATASPPAVVPPLHTHNAAPAVLVTGATGFVGRALVADLLRAGRRVIAWSRDARHAQALLGPAVWVVENLDAIPAETRIDAVVNLAGARVLGLPWTAARRRTLLDSRVRSTAAVVALMRRLQQAPRVLASASAVGYYGAAPAGAPFEPCDESSPPRPGQFQSDLCAATEHEARRAEALGVRVVRLRFGVVLGQGGGAWPMQALAARLGFGALLGSGRQAAPWVHLDDAVGLVRHALAHPRLAGALNVVAPDIPPQARFARTMAASFGRKVHLRLPALPLRWAAGEMSTLLLDGQNVLPGVARGTGYRYRYPTLDAAMAALAAGRRPAAPRPGATGAPGAPDAPRAPGAATGG
jgi:uncharacterized protein (TIGR01777 family)